MGIVYKQASKRTIFALIGAAIGVLSNLFIYSKKLDVYGEIQFIISMVSFFVPFASFGVVNLANRYYPYFKSEKNRDFGFFGNLILAGVVSYVIFLVVAVLFQNKYYKILSLIGFDLYAFKNYNSIIFICLFLLILNSITAMHINNFKKIVVPYLINTFSLKIFLPIVFILNIYDWLTEDQVYSSLIYFYMLFLTLHSIKLKEKGGIECL